MDSQRAVGRILLGAGIVLVLIGLLLATGSKLPFRLGRLPGDIAIKRDHFTLYFPLATSLIISLGLTLLAWLLRRRP